MKDHSFYPPAIFDLLPEDVAPAKLIAKVEMLLEYFRDGYEYYQQHISAEDLFEFSESEKFLDRLVVLTHELNTTEGSVQLILHRDNHKINVLPMNKFLNEYSPEQCLANIDVINSALVAYLHAKNCLEYKVAMDTLTNWKYIFKEIA